MFLKGFVGIVLIIFVGIVLVGVGNDVCFVWYLFVGILVIEGW